MRVETHALAADGAGEVHRAVQVQFRRAGAAGYQREKAAVGIADRHRLRHGVIVRRPVERAEAGGGQRFDQVQAAAGEQRRIAGIGADADMVEAQADFQGDDMLDHADVIVGRAGAQDDITDHVAGGPDIARRDGESQGVVPILPLEPPAVPLGRLEGQRTRAFAEKRAGPLDAYGPRQGGLPRRRRRQGLIRQVPIHGLPGPPGPGAPQDLG